MPASRQFCVAKVNKVSSYWMLMPALVNAIIETMAFHASALADSICCATDTKSTETPQLATCFKRRLKLQFRFPRLLSPSALYILAPPSLMHLPAERIKEHYECRSLKACSITHPHAHRLNPSNESCYIIAITRQYRHRR